MAENRNLFRLTRFVLLRLPLFFKLFAKFRVKEKRILIIKTDAIGDYILFRNFIEITRLSERYKEYQIDLLGNKKWQDLALKADGQHISSFIFINPDSLYQKPIETLKLGYKLFKNNYCLVLHPTWSRTLIADGLAALTVSKNIIGFESDYERIAVRYKNKTDLFYTQLLNPPQLIAQEFKRSIYFFEAVLRQTVNIKGPRIPFEKTTAKKGIILCPGSGVEKRNWGADNFLALIKLIFKHTHHEVYITGGPDEEKSASYLEKNSPSLRLHNLTGKTTLSQLTEIIGNAILVISNETSAAHIAAATKTKSICILGGGHFGRFAPYPDELENKPLCVYEKMDCYNCNWNCKFASDDNAPYPCISAISLDKVWVETQKLLLTI